MYFFNNNVGHNMKKILFTIIILAGLFHFSQAQEVGIRFGDAFGGHFAVDGVFGLGGFSRIHADVSFGDGLGIDLLWDFLYRPLGGEAFNWYAGVGPYIWINDPFWFGAVGELGLEYQFNSIPISLSLDWRPALSIVEKTDLHFGGFGLNVRYVFGR